MFSLPIFFDEECSAVSALNENRLVPDGTYRQATQLKDALNNKKLMRIVLLRRKDGYISKGVESGVQMKG